MYSSNLTRLASIAVKVHLKFLQCRLSFELQFDLVCFFRFTFTFRHLQDLQKVLYISTKSDLYTKSGALSEAHYQYNELEIS